MASRSSIEMEEKRTEYPSHPSSSIQTDRNSHPTTPVLASQPSSSTLHKEVSINGIVVHSRMSGADVKSAAQPSTSGTRLNSIYGRTTSNSTSKNGDHQFLDGGISSSAPPSEYPSNDQSLAPATAPTAANSGRVTSEPLFDEAGLNFSPQTWRYTLKFPNRALEHHFFASFHSKAIFMVRFVTLLIMLGNLAAISTDFVIYPDTGIRTDIWILRLCLITPISLLYLWFTRHELFFAHRQSSTFLYTLAVGVSMIALSARGGEPNHGTYIILFNVFALFYFLRFFVATALNLLLLITFAVGNYFVTWHDRNESKQWVLSFGYLLLTNVMLFIMGYYIESSFRSAFLQMQRLTCEQHKTNVVLYNVLPKTVAQSLVRGIRSADYYKSASILFCDIYDFKNLTSELGARDLVCMMNDVFSIFDHLTDRHDVLKIETIGEVYMAASGLPEQTETHAQACCYLAFDMLQSAQECFIYPNSNYNPHQSPSDPDFDAAKNYKYMYRSDLPVRHFNKMPNKKRIILRIGIHTGDVIAGVIGVKLPRYRLFGDTVNTASRMQTTCEKDKIQISRSTYERVHSLFDFEDRGFIAVKGKGTMHTYYLKGIHQQKSSAETPDVMVSRIMSDQQLESITNMIKRKGTVHTINEEDSVRHQQSNAAGGSSGTGTTISVGGENALPGQRRSIVENASPTASSNRDDRNVNKSSSPLGSSRNLGVNASGNTPGTSQRQLMDNTRSSAIVNLIRAHSFDVPGSKYESRGAKHQNDGSEKATPTNSSRSLAAPGTNSLQSVSNPLFGASMQSLHLPASSSIGGGSTGGAPPNLFRVKSLDVPTHSARSSARTLSTSVRPAGLLAVNTGGTSSTTVAGAIILGPAESPRNRTVSAATQSTASHSRQATPTSIPNNVNMPSFVERVTSPTRTRLALEQARRSLAGSTRLSPLSPTGGQPNLDSPHTSIPLQVLEQEQVIVNAERRLSVNAEANAWERHNNAVMLNTLVRRPSASANSVKLPAQLFLTTASIHGVVDDDKDQQHDIRMLPHSSSLSALHRNDESKI